MWINYPFFYGHGDQQGETMTYAQWVEFVVGAFIWETSGTTTFHGYLKDRSRSGPGQDVQIEIEDETIKVTTYYRHILTYEEWKPRHSNPMYAIWPYRYDDRNTYEFLLERCKQKLEESCYNSFTIDGNELNLLPWVIKLVVHNN
jgi:hypothetical protein